VARKESSLLKAVSAKQRSKFAAQSPVAEKLLVRRKIKQTNKNKKQLWRPSISKFHVLLNTSNSNTAL
jgi:hypothetical protein